ncbi:MAG: GNAT family N-acetyltransferase [Anaerolineae bacterium]|uniref:GNAT family N-acetyltransferase n=1 Tax=Candidatus Amarolinea dominans TaxID=3140696 RepID=UPI003135E39E|nr:GNAT family N-acetyltransferase [Anaerolineae bacterium]
MQPTSDGAINIRPMGDDLVTTLCLHHGPLAAAQLRHSPDNGVDARLLHHPWPDSLLDELAPRLGQNLVCPPGASSERREFLREVNHRYGTCAIQAWHDDKIVGVIRFFPSALLLRMGRSSEGLRHSWFWPAVEADDPANTLFIQCIEMGAPTFQSGLLALSDENNEDATAYQRRGIGTALAQALVTWARERGWARLQIGAGQDLDIIYGLVGSGGRTFWEKLGFRTHKELPALPWTTTELPVLSYQASKARIGLDEAARQWLMVLDL